MEELILKEREVKENIVQIINMSGLPAIILKPIFNNILVQLDLLEQQQYANALESKQQENENQGGDKKGK